MSIREENEAKRQRFMLLRYGVDVDFDGFVDAVRTSSPLSQTIEEGLVGMATMLQEIARHEMEDFE